MVSALNVFLLALSFYIIHQCVLFASCIQIPPGFPKIRKFYLSIGISLLAAGSLVVALDNHCNGSIIMVIGLALYFLSDSKECVVVKR